MAHCTIAIIDINIIKDIHWQLSTLKQYLNQPMTLTFAKMALGTTWQTRMIIVQPRYACLVAISSFSSWNCSCLRRETPRWAKEPTAATTPMIISSPRATHRSTKPARVSLQSREKSMGVVCPSELFFHLHVQLCNVSFFVNPEGWLEDGW